MVHKPPCLETKESDAYNASFLCMVKLELLHGLPLPPLHMRELTPFWSKTQSIGELEKRSLWPRHHLITIRQKEELSLLLTGKQ